MVRSSVHNGWFTYILVLPTEDSFPDPMTSPPVKRALPTKLQWGFLSRRFYLFQVLLWDPGYWVKDITSGDPPPICTVAAKLLLFLLLVNFTSKGFNEVGSRVSI
uniref:Uncharacterized protein n=1 Tax=Cacopsylla melanoneura TaxID=428564 RepID=A0A8D9ARK3_9HEMI